MTNPTSEAARRAAERVCAACRYWDAHDIDERLGDCRAPSEHRYWQFGRAPFKGVVFMDSFGREETKPDYSCHAWKGADELDKVKE